MSTDGGVTHPGVAHPQAEVSAASPEVAQKPAATPPSAPADARTTVRKPAPRWKMPPPQVIAAIALAVAALELLLWQVGGLMLGIVVHAVLLLMLAVAVGLGFAWRRRQVRRTAAAVGRARGGRSASGGAVRPGRSPLGRLLGRSGGRAGGSGGSAGGSGRRGGLLGRLGGGSGRRGLSGARSGGVGSGRGGGLGRLLSGGRRSGSGGSGSGRSGSGLRGLLGGRRTAGVRSGGATGRGSGGSRLGRMRAAGRGLLGGRSGSGGTSRSVGRGLLGGASRSAGARSGGTRPRSAGFAGFLKGVREGSAAVSKPAAGQARKPSPGPSAKKPEQPKVPEEAKAAEKPQPPTTEQLVKEAVKKVAAISAPTAATVGGPQMGDMNKIRSAADELAAALKEYDPETMHQMVREMPQLGEALNTISQGFRHVASRAESEWPVAAPVAEGLRSIANDIKAGAGTAEETRATVHKENETDIERGEAPRHGSHSVERKWNV